MTFTAKNLTHAALPVAALLAVGVVWSPKATVTFSPPESLVAFVDSTNLLRNYDAAARKCTVRSLDMSMATSLVVALKDKPLGLPTLKQNDVAVMNGNTPVAFIRSSHRVFTPFDDVEIRGVAVDTFLHAAEMATAACNAEKDGRQSPPSPFDGENFGERPADPLEPMPTPNQKRRHFHPRDGQPISL